MSSEIAIKAEQLSKNYLIYNSPQDRLKQSLWRGRKQFYNEFRALQNISFTVGRGETVGIVGRNGSGKSTLLQIICGTVTPSSGECTVNGRISALLELGAGFNPEFTGKENIFLNGAILGLSQEEIAEKYSSIVEFSGIGDKVNNQVKTYSSGMYVRLAFAVAVASDPDILIVDEALAVGDEIFQRKCFARIKAIQERGGTILFVSHAASTVVEICDRALLLDGGELLLTGTPKQIVSHYHKLIFAPADKEVLVREQIKQGGTSEAPEMPAQEEQAPPQEAYDQAMIPESLLSYESCGARISAPAIETLSGEKVNLLNRAERYRFTFNVEFTEACYGVRFGMLIKTKSGIELGGTASSAPGSEAIEYSEAGTIRKVEFIFTCLLLPGTYFMNCGCLGIIEGAETFLHRMVDACMFKVLPEKDLSATGIIDFIITPSTSIIKG
jgi:lipopolysaccharide transport system ATP-binding protein